MPIWLELLVLLLIAYAGGLAIGWTMWGRTTAPRSTGRVAQTTGRRQDDG